MLLAVLSNPTTRILRQFMYLLPPLCYSKKNVVLNFNLYYSMSPKLRTDFFQ